MLWLRLFLFVGLCQGWTGIQRAWPRYLVEFRGLYDDFRMQELQDSISSILFSDVTAREVVENAEYVILSREFPGQPACAYILLPSDEIARKIIERCSCTRSLIEVWGQGTSPEEVCASSLRTFDSTAAAIFDTSSSLSWKVEFRRLGRVGRSGLDPAGKRAFLQVLSPVLSRLHGEVDLEAPQHTLLFLEDWLDFHSSQSASTATATATETRSQRFAVFGRIVARGPEVQSLYDLSQRPFIGTTTMPPLPAHLCALAARVGPGMRVLDPFCGTGSMLIAAASLGAQSVVGSDVDGESLGVDSTVPTMIETDTSDGASGADRAAGRAVATVSGLGEGQGQGQGGSTGSEDDKKKKNKGKNSSFRRYTRSQSGHSHRDSSEGASSENNTGPRSWTQQYGLSALDNFRHYGLSDCLEGPAGGLLQREAGAWLAQQEREQRKEQQQQRTQQESWRGESTKKWLEEQEQEQEQEQEHQRQYKLRPWLDEVFEAGSGRFDAICTDPPYNRRERVLGSGLGLIEGEGQGEGEGGGGAQPEDSIVATLLALAAVRLRPGGGSDPGPFFAPSAEENSPSTNARLSFWYPTESDVDEAEVRRRLDECASKAELELARVAWAGAGVGVGAGAGAGAGVFGAHRSSSSGDNRVVLPLRLERLTVERLHSKLWRWLCVYRRD